ncbi:ABC transporter substrate-binding protein [Deferribacter autotrophicus]|uniref:ABC transporter substrate-binding protein n=1 Tax=Deferribacter autotrophicus TaxID=500465 RepID=A0A5A8F0J8_9BACT|nr:ABC transporter substrate-binding protein [Deferribacter autotrophicus]KAA0256837.1 ABC transporter substrate-binding protein [Deferribacter autotrophicus]
MKPDIKIKDLLQKKPKAVNFFKSIGFKNIEKENSPLRLLTLNSLANMKKINVDTLISQLEEYLEIEENKADITLLEQNKKGDITIAGVLPCPVRIPLLEKINEKIEEFELSKNHQVNINLESASKGLEWMKEIIDFDNPDTIPDISISAGFEFFLYEKSKKLIKKGFFEDVVPTPLNSDFEDINLKDPYNALSVFSVVPAIFMVNLEELNGREIPKSWKDLIFGDYENLVSIPVGDFDLFNSILIHIYADYGEEGIERLQKIMFTGLHPTVAVKTQQMKNSQKPAVTVMPYFFSRMVGNLQTVKIIWPEDGAIISPIFALVRKDKKDKIKPLTDALISKEVGEILSHRGLFPSLNPEVKNTLIEPGNFKWVGWNYLFENNVEELIIRLNKRFESLAGVVK